MVAMMSKILCALVGVTTVLPNAVNGGALLDSWSTVTENETTEGWRATLSNLPALINQGVPITAHRTNVTGLVDHLVKSFGPMILRRLFRLSLEQHKLDDCMDLVNEHPKIFNNTMYHGDVLFAGGDYPEAKRVYMQVLAIIMAPMLGGRRNRRPAGDPIYTQGKDLIFTRLGLTFQKLGKMEEAKRFLEWALDIQQSKGLFREAVTTLTRMGRYEEASQLVPTDVSIESAAALEMMGKGNATMHHPSNSEYDTYWSFVAGSYSAAISELRNRGSPKDLLLLATVMREFGSRHEALSLYEMFGDNDPYSLLSMAAMLEQPPFMVTKRYRFVNWPRSGRDLILDDPYLSLISDDPNETYNETQIALRACDLLQHDPVKLSTCYMQVSTQLHHKYLDGHENEQLLSCTSWAQKAIDASPDNSTVKAMALLKYAVAYGSSKRTLESIEEYKARNKPIGTALDTANELLKINGKTMSFMVIENREYSDPLIVTEILHSMMLDKRSQGYTMFVGNFDGPLEVKEELLHELIELTGEDGSNYKSNLAWVKMRLCKYDDALALFHEQRESYTNPALYFSNVAQAHADKGDWEAAYESYEQLANSEDGSAYGYIGMGRARLEQEGELAIHVALEAFRLAVQIALDRRDVLLLQQSDAGATESISDRRRKRDAIVNDSIRKGDIEGSWTTLYEYGMKCGRVLAKFNHHEAALEFYGVAEMSSENYIPPYTRLEDRMYFFVEIGTVHMMLKNNAKVSEYTIKALEVAKQLADDDPSKTLESLEAKIDSVLQGKQSICSV